MSNLELINIYKKSSSFFYNEKNNIEQKSKHWQRYSMKKFNTQNLQNFRKNGELSGGLDDASNKVSFELFSEIVNEISEEYIINNSPKKNIGNSNHLIKFKDVFIDYNKLIHIYWFWTLENKISRINQISSICEIGGGFGSFIELFIKNYNCKVFLIDLPEANLMSTYYLQQSFPKKNFFLFCDYEKKNKLTLEDFEKNDIIILPPNCNIDKQIKFDLFINTRSMMEMNKSVIKTYFDFIHNYSRNESLFLNINRYEKKSVGYPIRISEYPYDSLWKVLISQPSFKQNWIHFLLTQRVKNSDEANIFQELNRIKKIEKSFYDILIDDSVIYLKSKKNLRVILKRIFGTKILKSIGNFLFKIGSKLKNID
ncbi:putative sugar O-methyltransferase [Pelagibacterales bacterium SAG-MED37]|nr:putative sugar O-methyltransferase [Pelagibacterales bacterium SAG-MED37]